MNIEDLTIKQLKEIQSIGLSSNPGLSSMLGKKVIIRTDSAGVWFGELAEKSGNEVILKNARRMYRWKTLSGMSLSEISNNGIDIRLSRICEPVNLVWLEAIEILPCSSESIKSIEGAENAKTL